MAGMLKQQQIHAKNVVMIVNTVLKMLPILEDILVNLAHQQHYCMKEIVYHHVEVINMNAHLTIVVIVNIHVKLVKMKQLNVHHVK